MADHRLAVVTPYHDEPQDMLERCHRSVLRQGLPVDHILVADGRPLACVDDWEASHVRLPRAHGDNGNTPRGVGSLLAASEGSDFVAYLDADNWYHDGHLRSLLDLWERTRSPVCASFRTFHDDAGTGMRVHERDEDELRHIDTSCLLVHRTAFECLRIWAAMPRILSPIGDRVFLAGLVHHRFAVSSTRSRTVAFRSRYRSHYVAAGLPPPDDAKDETVFAPARDYLASAEGVGACVRALGYWPLAYVRF